MSRVEMLGGVAEPTDLPVGTGRLWYGLLIGAGAWKLQLMVNYALVPVACWQDLSILLHFASLAMLVLALSGSWVSYGSWRALGSVEDIESGGATGRARFMAASGIATGLFFTLLIVGQWLPNLLLGPCDGIN